MKVLVSFIRVCVTLPIWVYLLYKMMEASKATELMWFLFWVYVPFLFFVQVVTDMAAREAAKAKTSEK